MANFPIDLAPIDPSNSQSSVLRNEKPQSHSKFVHSSFKGEPAITIPHEIEASLAAKFQNTLVGKFSQGKPRIELIRRFIDIQNFEGTVHAGVIDKKHVLLRFDFSADYVRMFSRSIWKVDGKPMRILKWTPDFRIDRESSVIPIWVSLPMLPIHLVNEAFIFSLVSSFSKPLRIDSATEQLKRPSVARVLVEFDLLDLMPSRVWVQRENRTGFWQSVVIEEALPPYCLFCWHIGHQEQFCTVKHPNLHTYTQKQAPSTHTEYRPKQSSLVIELGNEQQQVENSSAGLNASKTDKETSTNIGHAGSTDTGLDAISIQQDVFVNGDIHLVDDATMTEEHVQDDQASIQAEQVMENQMVQVILADEAAGSEECIKDDAAAKLAISEKPAFFAEPQHIDLGHSLVHGSASSLIGGEIVAEGKTDEVIKYSEGCPISNPFEVLSIPLTKEKLSGIDKLSIQAELRYMISDPKARLREYISDKDFEEKFTPVKKITRIRKPKQILDL